MERFFYIRYTMRHRKMFRKVEKRLCGKNSIRGYCHDLDKIFLYLFLGKRLGSKIHRKYARHHAKNAKTHQDYVQMVIDWECSRFTKPDKPYNAYHFLYMKYPQLEEKVLPILRDFNIDKSNLE